MYESAAITTTTSFVSAYIPLKVDAAKGVVSAVAPRISGQTAELAAKGILVVGSSVTDAGGDAAKAIVQGKSVTAAQRIAAMRFGTSLGTNALTNARAQFGHSRRLPRSCLRTRRPAFSTRWIGRRAV